MMRPAPCPSMTLTAARQQRNTLVRSTAMTRAQSSSLSSQIGKERPVIPALLTRMSRRPQVSTTRFTAASTSAVRVTSAAMAMAPPPTFFAAASAASTLEVQHRDARAVGG